MDFIERLIERLLDLIERNEKRILLGVIVIVILLVIAAIYIAVELIRLCG